MTSTRQRSVWARRILIVVFVALGSTLGGFSVWTMVSATRAAQPYWVFVSAVDLLIAATCLTMAWRIYRRRSVTR